jgi:ferredoxin
VIKQVRVDRTKCSGHARCFAVAPDLFPIDDAGFVAVDSVDIPAGFEEKARECELGCPEGAITLVRGN